MAKDVVVSPFLPTTGALSGQITVSTAGTAVQGTSVGGENGFYLTPKPTNTGYIYVGNDGSSDVSATTGFALSNSQTILVQVANLNQLYFDSSVNGEIVTWLKA